MSKIKQIRIDFSDPNYLFHFKFDDQSNQSEEFVASEFSVETITRQMFDKIETDLIHVLSKHADHLLAHPQEWIEF